MKYSSMFDNKQGIYSTIFIINFRTGLFIRTPEVSIRLYTIVNIPIIIMMFNMYVPADGLFLLNVPNDDNNNIITPIDTIRLNEPIKKVFNVSFKVVGTDVELLYHNIIVIKNITTNEIVNRFEEWCNCYTELNGKLFYNKSLAEMWKRQDWSRPMKEKFF